MAVQNPLQVLATNSKSFGDLSNGQIQLIQAVLVDDLTGMWGGVRRHSALFRCGHSMIIETVLAFPAPPVR